MAAAANAPVLSPIHNAAIAQFWHEKSPQTSMDEINSMIQKSEEYVRAISIDSRDPSEYARKMDFILRDVYGGTQQEILQARALSGNLRRDFYETKSEDQLKNFLHRDIEKTESKIKCWDCQKPFNLIQKDRSTIAISKRCAFCKEALYCNRDCQGRHWPSHKKVCQKKDK